MASLPFLLLKDSIGELCISVEGHEGLVMGMACDASGGLLATAGADREVLVWDVDGGFCTHYFKGHKGVVTSIMFHPEPNKLLVVNLWDLHDYSCKVPVPTYEALEAICVISFGSPFASCLALLLQQLANKRNGLPPIHFITVGEHGVVRIWSSDGALCLFEQKSSDISVSLDNDEVRRGFTSAMMSGQGLLCITADQQFLFYNPVEDPKGSLSFILSKRLIGYNEEIADMRFLGEEEQFVAVATSVEHESD